MNVFEKINEVMKRIEYLTKDDKVAFGNTKYSAISEEKVTSSVRKELVDVGIVIAPIEQTMVITELIRTEKSVNQRADVNVKYRIQNIEDVNDFIVVCSSGSGVDTQDKAIGKAMTYAYKYMLLRTFAIPTGEDPDKISSAETDDKMRKEIEQSKNQKINQTIVTSLTEAIRNKEYTKGYVNEVLGKYGYTKLEDIEVNNLANIKKDFDL